VLAVDECRLLDVKLEVSDSSINNDYFTLIGLFIIHCQILNVLVINVAKDSSGKHVKIHVLSL
jgi:hypothetical protein